MFFPRTVEYTASAHTSNERESTNDGASPGRKPSRKAAVKEHDDVVDEAADGQHSAARRGRSSIAQ